MNVAIEIPDDIARQLQARSGDVSKGALAAVAIEAYRAGGDHLDSSSADARPELPLGNRRRAAQR